MPTYPRKTMESSLPPRLVLFDGVCGLCDSTVQFLLDHDRGAKLHYTPLQGETAAGVIARHPELRDVDSIVFVERLDDGKGGAFEERVFVRSKAVFELARHLDGEVRWLRVFSVLPQALADAGYDWVASVRYRIFGKLEACRIPDAKVRTRFLP